jgi:hypothetical protein
MNLWERIPVIMAVGKHGKPFHRRDAEYTEKFPAKKPSSSSAYSASLR